MGEENRKGPACWKNNGRKAGRHALIFYELVNRPMVPFYGVTQIYLNALYFWYSYETSYLPTAPTAYCHNSLDGDDQFKPQQFYILFHTIFVAI
uniref:Very-long-chain 3-oxoacyl-CoA synthase n=1 Tax=Romanomermis culicivorax TaxID=13658 RepID=A0A915HP16_ROMCU